MLRLIDRPLEANWGHHQRLPVRVYESDPVQNDRISRAQKTLAHVLDEGLKRPFKAAILELGCGTGDISGPFSDDHFVKGIDCASQQIEKARERFPRGTWLVGPAEYFASGPWNVIVMCEFLEHVLEPEKMVKAWLPNCEFAIISHPIDEAPDSQLSGGDHSWSFSEEDFGRWFEIGGHHLEGKQVFQMGAYRVALGWSKRII